jgi:hypothetical protein
MAMFTWGRFFRFQTLCPWTILPLYRCSELAQKKAPGKIILGSLFRNLLVETLRGSIREEVFYSKLNLMLF